MRNHAHAFSGPPWRHDAPSLHPYAEPATAAGVDDRRNFWERPSPNRLGDAGLTMTGAGSADQRFQRALADGNPRLVRAAAAELPDIGIAEAAAILLVIERSEPDNYEPTALRWLARLATAGPPLDLRIVAEAATALEALPHRPDARATLAALCTRAGLVT